MRYFVWLLLAVIAATSLCFFGCGNSTTLNRPQDPFKADDIGGGGGGGQ